MCDMPVNEGDTEFVVDVSNGELGDRMRFNVGWTDEAGDHGEEGTFCPDLEIRDPSSTSQVSLYFDHRERSLPRTCQTGLMRRGRDGAGRVAGACFIAAGLSHP